MRKQYLLHFAYSHSSNMPDKLSSGSKRLDFGLSLHQLLYFLYKKSEGYGDTAQHTGWSYCSPVAGPRSTKILRCAGSAHIINTISMQISEVLSLPASVCCLLITFANHLDPVQTGQNIGSDQDLNCLTLISGGTCISERIF